MEQFIAGLVSKTGIDKATAEKVVKYIMDNADQIPKLLGQSGVAKGVLDQLPGGVGALFGGSKK